MNIWQLFLGPVWWITRAVAILITLHVGWFWELRNSAKLVLSSYSATWSESVVEVRGAFFGVLNLKHMFGNVNRAWCSVPFRYVLTSLVKSGNVCGCHTQLDWRCWCTPAPSSLAHFTPPPDVAECRFSLWMFKELWIRGTQNEKTKFIRRTIFRFLKSHVTIQEILYY